MTRIASTKGNYFMLMQGEKMVDISYIGVIFVTVILLYALMMIIVAKEKGDSHDGRRETDVPDDQEVP